MVVNDSAMSVYDLVGNNDGGAEATTNTGAQEEVHSTRRNSFLRVKHFPLVLFLSSLKRRVSFRGVFRRRPKMGHVFLMFRVKFSCDAVAEFGVRAQARTNLLGNLRLSKRLCTCRVTHLERHLKRYSYRTVHV